VLFLHFVSSETHCWDDSTVSNTGLTLYVSILQATQNMFMILSVFSLALICICPYFFQRVNLLQRLQLSHYMPWRRLGGEEVQLLLILDLSTRWDEWSASGLGHTLDQGTAGWVGPRVSLDTEARGKNLLPLPRIKPWSPGCPVHRHYTDWTTPARRASWHGAYVTGALCSSYYEQTHFISIFNYFPKMKLGITSLCVCARAHTH
jgi:hypothetical protein